MKAEVQRASLQVLKNDAVWNKVEKLDIITNRDCRNQAASKCSYKEIIIHIYIFLYSF